MKTPGITLYLFVIKIAFMDKAMNSRGHWYVFDNVRTNPFSYISAFVQKTFKFSIAWYGRELDACVQQARNVQTWHNEILIFNDSL